MYRIVFYGTLCTLIFFTTVSCRTQHSDVKIKRHPDNGMVEVQLDGEEKEQKLTCEATSPTEADSFKWFKVAPKGGGVEELANSIKFQIDGGELTFTTENVDNGDRFRCRLTDENYADFEIIDVKATMAKSGAIQYRVEKLQRSYSVVESEDLKINCFILNRTAEGFDTSEIALKWYMWDTVDDLSFEQTTGNCSNLTMSSQWVEIIEKADSEEPHIKFLKRDGLQRAILKIEDAVQSDRRGYKCVAYNITKAHDDNDCSESTAFVRVKDKYAALWPFLGIVAEVITLLVCILIAEKRRASKESSEEEEEEEGVPGSSGNPNGDKNTVRQRQK